METALTCFFPDAFFNLATAINRSLFSYEITTGKRSSFDLRASNHRGMIFHISSFCVFQCKFFEFKSYLYEIHEYGIQVPQSSFKNIYNRCGFFFWVACILPKLTNLHETIILYNMSAFKSDESSFLYVIIWWCDVFNSAIY